MVTRAGRGERVLVTGALGCVGAWALKAARFTDFILLTAGDALDLSERTGRPLFILEERIKERLGLTVAPVIVAQEGKKLVLHEYAPKRPADRSARP